MEVLFQKEAILGNKQENKNKFQDEGSSQLCQV